MTDIQQPLINVDGQTQENGEGADAPEESGPAASPGNFFKRVFYAGTYDKAFLGTLGSLYVNGGMKVLYSLVLREIFRK